MAKAKKHARALRVSGKSENTARRKANAARHGNAKSVQAGRKANTKPGRVKAARRKTGR